MDIQSPTQKFSFFSTPIPIRSTLKNHVYVFSIFLFIVISVTISTIINPFSPQSLIFINLSSNPNHHHQQKGLENSQERCDYTQGEWVWDERHLFSSYKETCQFLDPGFRCHQNGRANQTFRQWHWQPSSCDLPRFNASDFLERSRNGRIVFAGDSIGRNQWESLLCMLSKGVSNQSSVYEANGIPITRHKGFFSIIFKEFNLSVEYYRVPFLVHIGPAPLKSPGQVRGSIKLDKLHWYSEKWSGADVFVFNTGHWWNEDKTTRAPDWLGAVSRRTALCGFVQNPDVRGIYFQEGQTVNVTMHFMEAFRRSIRTWRSWAEQKLDPQKSHIFFQSYSPIHFRNGTWNTGGTCRESTSPKKNKTKLEAYLLYNQYISQVAKDMEAAKMKVKFLNITYLSEFRSDGHPSIHHEPIPLQPVVKDCSHWCLSGIPDTWNELFYANLLVKDFRTRPNQRL